jgi:hypothetical protein
MLELLRGALPNVCRVAVLRDPTNPSHSLYWRQLEASARTQRLALMRADVRRADELDTVIANIGGGRVAEGLLVMHQPLTWVYRKRIVALAAEHRLPAVYSSREAVHDGGLIAFGPSLPAIYRRAATFVDRILKGTKPCLRLRRGSGVRRWGLEGRRRGHTRWGARVEGLDVTSPLISGVRASPNVPAPVLPACVPCDFSVLFLMAAPLVPGPLDRLVLADPILRPTREPPLLSSQIQQEPGHPRALV